MQFDRKLIKRFLKGDAAAAHTKVGDQMKAVSRQCIVAATRMQASMLL